MNLNHVFGAFIIWLGPVIFTSIIFYVFAHAVRERVTIIKAILVGVCVISILSAIGFIMCVGAYFLDK